MCMSGVCWASVLAMDNRLDIAASVGGKRYYFCLTRKRERRDDIESTWASGQINSCHLSMFLLVTSGDSDTRAWSQENVSAPKPALLHCTNLFFLSLLYYYSLQWNCKITVRHGWILLFHPGAVKNQILLLFLIHSQAFLHCFGTVWGCQMDTNLPPPLSPPG